MSRQYAPIASCQYSKAHCSSSYIIWLRSNSLRAQQAASRRLAATRWSSHSRHLRTIDSPHERATKERQRWWAQLWVGRERMAAANILAVAMREISCLNTCVRMKLDTIKLTVVVIRCSCRIFSTTRINGDVDLRPTWAFNWAVSGVLASASLLTEVERRKKRFLQLMSSAAESSSQCSPLVERDKKQHIGEHNHHCRQHHDHHNVDQFGPTDVASH